MIDQAALLTRRSLMNAIPAALLVGGAPRTLMARTLNVRDFGAAGDGRTDDTSAIRRAQDAAGRAGATLIFPPGVYSVVGWKDVGDMSLDWRSSGATIICHRRDIAIFSRFISLRLDGPALQGQAHLPCKARGVKPGALIFIASREIAETLRAEPISCQMAKVKAVSSSCIELDSRLKFNFNPGDLDMTIRVYESPRKAYFEGLRFIAAEDNLVRSISLVGVKGGLTFHDCTFETKHDGNVSDAPDGVMVLESIGVMARNLRIRNCRYGYMLSNGARDCGVYDLEARENRHPIYPAYWASSCTFEHIRGRRNVATIDSHSAFDIVYKDVVATDDLEMSNARSSGVLLEDVHIAAKVAKTFRIAVPRWIRQYRSMNKSHDAVLINVSLTFLEGVNGNSTAIWVGDVHRAVIRNVRTLPEGLIMSLARDTILYEQGSMRSGMKIVRRS